CRPFCGDACVKKAMSGGRYGRRKRGHGLTTNPARADVGIGPCMGWVLNCNVRAVFQGRMCAFCLAFWQSLLYNGAEGVSRMVVSAVKLLYEYNHSGFIGCVIYLIAIIIAIVALTFWMRESRLKETPIPVALKVAALGVVIGMLAFIPFYTQNYQTAQQFAFEEAVSLYEDNHCNEARAIFDSLSKYKNADALSLLCAEQSARYYLRHGRYMEAAALLREKPVPGLEEELGAMPEVEERLLRDLAMLFIVVAAVCIIMVICFAVYDKSWRTRATIALLLALLFAAGAVLCYVADAKETYAAALELKGDWHSLEARALFESIKCYQDAEAQAVACTEDALIYHFKEEHYLRCAALLEGYEDALPAWYDLLSGKYIT
ncbi:MAG: hypothetical protein ACSW8F_04130, partial [bacterium]